MTPILGTLTHVVLVQGQITRIDVTTGLTRISGSGNVQAPGGNSVHLKAPFIAGSKRRRVRWFRSGLRHTSLPRRQAHPRGQLPALRVPPVPSRGTLRGLAVSGVDRVRFMRTSFGEPGGVFHSAAGMAVKGPATTTVVWGSAPQALALLHHECTCHSRVLSH